MKRIMSLSMNTCARVRACVRACVSHRDSLLRVFDHLVTEELGGDEALHPVVQTTAHPNGLARTRAAVKVVPHLHSKQALLTSTFRTSSINTYIQNKLY